MHIFDKVQEHHRTYSRMMLTTKNFDDHKGGQGRSVQILMTKDKTTRKESRMPTMTTNGTVRATMNIMTEENSDDE